MARGGHRSWGVQGGASSTLLEAPKAPDIHGLITTATRVKRQSV
jgi:hypothetical protein